MENTNGFETPILFMIYHRPETTKRVFAEISKIKPKKLFISAGAPRNIPNDKELCEETRKITESITWDCEVHRLYEKVNIGGGNGCKDALNWFWNQVDEGIVLEDDCLPHPSFFPYCAELLERYRNDTKVMMISGNNFIEEAERSIGGDASYYFGRYPLTWGWASWKRVWNFYDYNMKTFPTIGETGLQKILRTRDERHYWLPIFRTEYESTNKNAWDYQFIYLIWMNDGICATPNVNLISNIGFGEGAANTTNPKHPGANLKTQEIVFPLVHPKDMAVNTKADAYVFRHHFIKKPYFPIRVRNALIRYAPAPITKSVLFIKKLWREK